VKRSFNFWNKNNLEFYCLKREAVIFQAPLSGGTPKVTLGQNNTKDTGIISTALAAKRGFIIKLFQKDSTFFTARKTNPA
jgi:hypothetical protein